MDWVNDNWQAVTGFAVLVGGFLSRRKLWQALVDMGMAQYYKAEAITLRELLTRKTADYDGLLKDHRALQDQCQPRPDSSDSPAG